MFSPITWVGVLHLGRNNLFALVRIANNNVLLHYTVVTIVVVVVVTNNATTLQLLMDHIGYTV
jgi:hypothetical protein